MSHKKNAKIRWLYKLIVIYIKLNAYNVCILKKNLTIQAHVFEKWPYRCPYTALGVIGIQDEDARCSCGGIQKKRPPSDRRTENHHKKQLSILKSQRYHETSWNNVSTIPPATRKK